MTPLGEAEIEALTALAEKATPAPWATEVADGGRGITGRDVEVWCADDDLKFVAQCGDAGVPSSNADAALIVAMRNALPELLRLARQGIDARKDGEQKERDAAFVRLLDATGGAIGFADEFGGAYVVREHDFERLDAAFQAAEAYRPAARSPISENSRHE